LTAYQLTINNGETVGYNLDALHNCDTCPETHLNEIAYFIYKKLEDFGVVFVALSLECGTHTHLHIYTQVAYKVHSIVAWQKMLPGVHVEPCRGTPQQNMDYLAKAGKWENDEKHGTLRWGPVTYGEMLESERGCPSDYVKLAMQAETVTQVFQAYPDAIRYSYAIKLIVTERNEHNENHTRR